MTIICGDIHCDWKYLNILINRLSPEVILQCGDFGWWPHFHNKLGFVPKKRFDQFGIKNHQNGCTTKIYWCGGNHENWDDLYCITDYEMIETQDDVFYCPFGTTLELNDGRRVLFAGGAKSTDIEDRVEGFSWWRNEEIIQRDMDHLPDTDIDIVISHTLPRAFMEKTKYRQFKTYGMERYNDSSTFALNIVYEKYKPSLWFCGHFHEYMKGEFNNCKWHVLAMPHETNWWWKL